MASPPKRKAPTVADVARLAGVGFATAARTLGGYGSVSADVRARVVSAAASLGYRPNRLARSMATGTSRTFGVVVADIENQFFARIVRGISDGARAAGFEVILVNSEENIDEERAAVRVLVEKQVDGLIVAPAAVDDFAHLAELRDIGMPIVLLDRNIPELAVDAVVIDGIQAAQTATEYLIGLGHSRIAIVTDVPLDSRLPSRFHPPEATATAGARLAGYLKAMRGARLPRDDGLIRCAKPTVAGAYQETAALLDMTNRPSAIFTTDNVMTLGTFEALRDFSVPVPGRISLVGFDDLDWSRIVHPPLTVVSQPVYELGATAARTLLRRIEGHPVRDTPHVLPTTLIPRGSSGPLEPAVQEPVASAAS
jgi:LacI family transcriptional regulator